MSRRRFAMVFFVAFIVGLLFTSNTHPSHAESLSPRAVSPIDYWSTASSSEQFVDNNISDVDGLSDEGTHSNFAGQQLGPDTIYDTLAEENTEPNATDVEDDYDSYSGDVDSSPDVGTEINPTNAQGTYNDSQFMTIQEIDVGDPYQSEWLDTDVYDATEDTGITKVGVSPYLDAQDYPANYVYTKAPGTRAGWWHFPNTTLTGDLSVNVSLYCWNVDVDTPDGFDVYYDTTGGPGTLLGRIAQHTARQYDNLTIPGVLTSEDVSALRIRLVFYKSGSAKEAYVDHLHLGVSSPEIVNYDADFEYEWINADYDETYEEVCVYIGAIAGTESLNVGYWNGGAWASLGQIGTTGWTNLTAVGLTSLSYTIRLRAADSTDDIEQGEWTIDLITLHTWSDQTYNYELDLEVQWTSALFDNNNEYLCIYAGTTDTEDLQIDVWDGVGWVNLFSDLMADSWNNISVETWLISATFTLRFKGGADLGDTTQSQWSIDATLLHTWNNFPLNDQKPTVSNIDDGTFMYARAREYQITAFVSDQDGYADIQTMHLSLYSNDRLTLYWTVQYDEDADSFAEYSDPSDYITLNTASSSAAKAGNDIDITFNVAIEWDHPDIVDSDAQCYVVDSKSENSTDWYEVDWDIETRLEVSGLGTDDNKGTVDRGDVDGTFYTSGTVTYLVSTFSPPSTEVDVWVFGSEYGTNTGPWE
ncbi:MAG: hypothetical protein ACXADS_15265, partial [Candidatus Thorarchaeota archaeon]